MESTFLIMGVAVGVILAGALCLKAMGSRRNDRMSVNINFDQAKDRESKYRY